MSTTAPTPSGPQPAASSRVRVTVRVPVEAERLWTTMWRPEILALWWGEGSRVPLQRRHPCTFFLVFVLSAGGCHCHAPLFSESGAQAQRARHTASASPHTLSAHRL